MTTPSPATGNTEVTQPENRAFYPALDGLRAIAFLMVFFHHYDGLIWGWSGVDLFFVLSGFLITGILYDTRDARHRAKIFYIRRTLRIFPLYYGILLVLVLIWPIMHWQWNWKWVIWPLYVGNFANLFPFSTNAASTRLAYFFLTGTVRGHHVTWFLGHFWSLCVEEQFYLVWPWVVFWLRDRRKLMWICALTLPACLIARTAGFFFLPPILMHQGILSHFTPFRIDDLLAGGLLALMLRGPSKETTLRLSRWLLPILFALVILCVVLFRAENIAWTSEGFTYTIGLTINALLAAVLIACSVQPDFWLAKLLSIRPLRWAGRISYGTYVFHDIFHSHYVHLAASLHLDFPYSSSLVALICTYLIAWLSFTFFESPFLNLKNRWTPSRSEATN